jgi:predicted TIM-barrel fold metal-dependent hydrolase
MARTYRVISADGHVETPPEAWVKYVPEAYKERAPRLVKLPEGGEGWIVEGMPMLHNGQNISGGKPQVKFRNDSYWNPDGTPAPGAGSPQQRLREQDQDGIDAEVLFPPIFATGFLTGIADKRAYLAMVQAYNTWLAQDFCAAAPDRLIGNGVIPVSGLDDAIAELKRCKELGLRSVCLAQFPNGGGRPAPEDDRFWETALVIGMRLSPHLSIGDATPPAGNLATGTGDQEVAAAIIRHGPRPMFSLAQIILSGVLDRIPDLEFYFAETDAGWMPLSFYRIDDAYLHYKTFFGIELKMLPSEYIRKHCYFSFIRDPLAIQLREFLPFDRLMWGSDFPHSVGSFPRSREWLATHFEGVPEDRKRRILVDNPSRFFGLDPDKPLTPTPD